MSVSPRRSDLGIDAHGYRFQPRVHPVHHAVSQRLTHQLTLSGSALIEQIILVVEQELPLLDDELEGLAAELERALLASIDRAPASVAQSLIPTDHYRLGEP